MKNLYLILGLLSLSINALSQLQLSAAYYHENAFHTKTTLNNVHNFVFYENDCSDITKWITSDSLTQAGFRHSNQQISNYIDYHGEMLSTGFENGYFLINGSEYLENGTVTNQNSYLELDTTFNLSWMNEGILEFDQKYRAFNYEETYVEISIDNGLSWQILDSSNNSELPNGPIYNTSKRIPLKSNHLVSNVRFRFHWRNDSTDNLKGSGYIWAIDNIRIKSDAENDIELIEVLNYSEHDSLDYYIIHYGNFHANFGGVIQNKTSTTQQVIFELFNNDNNQMYRSDTVSILPFQVDTVFLNELVDLMYLGWENTSFQCKLAQESSTIIYNDSIQQNFDMSNWIFGRDQFKYITDFTGLNNLDTHAIKIGNKMSAPYDFSFRGLNIAFGSNETSLYQTIWGEVWRFNSTTDHYEYVERTSEFTISGSDLGTVATLCLESWVDLNAGDKYLILACYDKPVDLNSDGKMDPPRFILSQQTSEGSVVGFIETGEYFELMSPRVVMIRTEYCTGGIDDEFISKINIRTYPNPFSSTLTVETNNINNEVITLEIYNLDGRIVFQKNNATLLNGTIDLNLGTLSNGVYTLKVISDEGVSESKIIKQ